MKSSHIKKLVLLSIFIISLSVFVIYKGIETYNAHNTFEGYCTRRNLVVKSKESNFGYCENITTNKIYKIVLFEKKWFLDRDLPCGFLCF